MLQIDTGKVCVWSKSRVQCNKSKYKLMVELFTSRFVSHFLNSSVPDLIPTASYVECAAECMRSYNTKRRVHRRFYFFTGVYMQN